MTIELHGALTPRVLDKAWALRRWATGARWLELLVGAFNLFMYSFAPFDPVVALTGALGILLITGAALPLYRRAFTYRSNPGVFEHGTLRLDEDGLRHDGHRSLDGRVVSLGDLLGPGRHGAALHEGERERSDAGAPPAPRRV